jgi:hypothetical protein
MKTSELTGKPLAWAVAKCEGIIVTTIAGSSGLFIGGGFDKFKPSTDWSQGGPIIEREMIHLTRQYGKWVAKMYMDDGVVSAKDSEPLIAAMRCYVASRLGDEVEIPKELK